MWGLDMQSDKSLFYYGSIYHGISDPQLAEGRQAALDLVAEGSSVLDIACGTGQLCFALREQKSCCVVGIDLSQGSPLRFRSAQNKPEHPNSLPS